MLCTNAYQAMAPSGGVLEVSLTPVAVDSELERKHGGLHEGLYVRLTVRDTGAGIDPAARARIFDPFFTTKARRKGTGLGLAIVHGIVTGSGGAITVRSEPGTGTSFHLYFPRPESKVHRQPEAVEGLLNGKERILLVDDEDMLLEVSRRMLESLGYEVTERTSGMTALESFRSEPGSYDLVVSDVTMPGMTGVELSRRLMEIRPDIPIILSTGFSELITPEEAKRLGIRELIMKPYDRRQLAETIRRVFDTRKDH